MAFPKHQPSTSLAPSSVRSVLFLVTNSRTIQAPLLAAKSGATRTTTCRSYGAAAFSSTRVYKHSAPSGAFPSERSFS